MPSSHPAQIKTNPLWEPNKSNCCSCHIYFQGIFAEDNLFHKGKDSMSPEDLYDSEQDDLETCKAVFSSPSCSL